MHCIHCNSSSVHSRGTNSSGKKKYRCQDCSKWFSMPSQIEQSSVTMEEHTVEIKSTKTRFVITSAQSRTPINENFFASIQRYIKSNDAQLIIIPILYNNKNAITVNEETTYDLNEELEYDERLTPYLTNQNIKLHENLKVLASLKINACAESPLSGLDSVTKGDSVIVGHSQLAMKTLAVQQEDMPVILTTTGTISNKNYSESKTGYKAGFNHSYSAVVVELDGDRYHIRHLNFDGTGFYDFETYYRYDREELTGRIEALITGDEHATFADPKVKDATYINATSLVSVLQPKVIVRHDLLDCYSVSHHHKHNMFINYAKFTSGKNSISDELKATVEYVIDTTPYDTKNIIVSSNHNDHLTRWLNECEVKHEPWNAVIYHFLMYHMLSRTSMKASHAEYPNPFELYSEETFREFDVDVEFLSRVASYKICDIELASHGDKGQNGARGSRRQFANLPSKTIIGHSHSPGIDKGCYQVGTSSYLQLEYNAGASSWLNTHCIIYPNGKRQLVNIINGKWRN